MTRNGPLTWVGVAGFEPAASSSRTKRAAKLRYTPPTAHASLADGAQWRAPAKSLRAIRGPHGLSPCSSTLRSVGPRNERQQGGFRSAEEPERRPWRGAQPRRHV